MQTKYVSPHIKYFSNLAGCHPTCCSVLPNMQISGVLADDSVMLTIKPGQV